MKKIPNWIIHNKWAKKAGINDNIANIVNRAVDYGFNWMFFKEHDLKSMKAIEDPFYQQLQFFYKKNKNNLLYIKALYLHQLLDFFKETNVKINDIELVFKKFLQDKVVVEIQDSDGIKVNFQEQIEEIFNLIRENKEKLFKDLKS